MKVKEAQSCPTLQLLGLYSPWNFPDQNTEVGSLSLLQGIFPTQGSNPGLLHCWQIFYQLSRKEPKNIGVVSLFLLQQTFPTKESNWGLLHCRWILYQLSYRGSPCNLLISCAPSRGPGRSGQGTRSHMPQLRAHVPQGRLKIAHATAKTQHSQTKGNKFF